jgi:DNA polymerase-3 subunit delta'
VSWTAIAGQPLAVRLLRQAVSGDKVAHAYLFTGPEGVGKRTVALELTKALNCVYRTSEGGACDQCLSCRKLSIVPPIYPDLMVVAPEGRFIKTDQVRELQAVMYARPNEGKVRTAIIDGVDRMNAESANRLLKLLEEPPSYAILILLTHNLSGVLPTLISRCQVVNFTPIGTEDVADALRKLPDLDPGQANVLASLSGGSIGRAMAMALDPAVAERREETRQFLLQLHNQDDFALMQTAESLEKQKEHLDAWLELALMWLRDALVVAQTGLTQLVINSDKLLAVQTLADELGVAGLLDMLGSLTDARGQLQRNANTRLVLDVLVVRLGDIARKGHR